MTPSNDERCHCYRGALVLNNVGVSMLEHGCYKEAVSTLKDAVYAMTCFCRPSPSCWDVGQKVKQAFKTLAGSHPLQTSYLRIETVSYEDRIFPLQCLTDNDEEGEGYNVQSMTGRLRPTRIEFPDDISSGCSERDSELESAVLLCNYGIAYFLFSKTVVGHSTSIKLLENAHTVFELASSIVSNRFASCQDSDYIDEARILSVVLLVVGNVSQVHQETGKWADAQELHERCAIIKKAVRTCDPTEWFGPVMAQKSSAAAA